MHHAKADHVKQEEFYGNITAYSSADFLIRELIIKGKDRRQS